MDVEMTVRTSEPGWLKEVADAYRHHEGKASLARSLLAIAEITK